MNAMVRSNMYSYSVCCLSRKRVWAYMLDSPLGIVIVSSAYPIKDSGFTLAPDSMGREHTL